jgi:Raf kinase inhibitor-like YbhB/YbcL family protein
MGFALSNLSVTSAAFSQGATIPTKHTGEGDDVSPPLNWSQVPEGARSFAVFCHDPDAPLVSAGGDYGFVHWLIYNIPGSESALEEGVGGHASGRNSFGGPGYGGPMPPEGHGLHHYYFWVLALAMEPGLPDGLELPDFLARVEPHILGMNRLVGTYQRD